MKRRSFLAGVVAVPVSNLVLPDTLPMRRAVFEEVGGGIVMTLALPQLIPAGDEDALAAIDSGFDTTLRYELSLFEHGTRRPITSTVQNVRLRRDPWTKRYLVARQHAHGWTKLYFDDATTAIATAVRLDRVAIIEAEKLSRGQRGPYYFVTVLGMRNPLEPEGWDSRAVSGRGQGRDLEWFGRLVEVFAGERPTAEEIVHVRSNPFYLVPRS